MKRVLLLGCAIILGAGLAAAQATAPKAEIFGGYSYLRADISGLTTENFNGWEASVTGDWGKIFGITADVSGHYKSFTGVKVNDYTVAFGPQFAYRTPHFTPYAHALFGFNRASATVGGSTIPIIGGLIPSASDSDTAFASAVGGGLDLNLNRNFAVRVGQFDYLYTRHLSTRQNNFRYSAGIVVRLGGK